MHGPLPKGLTPEMVEIGAAVLNERDRESVFPGPEGWPSLEDSAVKIWVAMEAAHEAQIKKETAMVKEDYAERFERARPHIRGISDALIAAGLGSGEIAILISPIMGAIGGEPIPPQLRMLDPFRPNSPSADRTPI